MENRASDCKNVTCAVGHWAIRPRVIIDQSSFTRVCSAVAARERKSVHLRAQPFLVSFSSTRSSLRWLRKHTFLYTHAGNYARSIIERYDRVYTYVILPNWINIRKFLERAYMYIRAHARLPFPIGAALSKTAVRRARITDPISLYTEKTCKTRSLIGIHF